MNASQFPLVRITVFFISGILFAQAFKPKLHWVLFSVLVVFCLTGLSYFLTKKARINPLFFGICALTCSFLIGIFSLVSSIRTRDPHHYVHQLDGEEKTGRFEVRISEKLKTTAYFERYVGSLYRFNGHKSSGKVLLHIKKTDSSYAFAIGSRLLLRGTIQKSRKPNNPNQFDYGKYLENQQIYGQLYTQPKDIEVAVNPERSLTYYAGKLRNRIIHNLEKNHFGKAELAVASALILGQQQEISEDILRDYQFAGAIHILSVSGLHVGLVLLFVTFLLKPVPNTRKSAFVKLIIVIASLWAFGILAGLAPSVVRSVTMFSFVALGLFLRRSVNIYNTLFISILLILLVRPSFLFDVGFQLSYLALFFIVWLQPLLNGIWQPKNRVLRYFWDIITVSFAAQIGTLPLSIYYFHQFPGLFFVTNLIVLPMLGAIMALGVLVMLLAAFDWVWPPLAKLLEGMIGLLNSIIGWVASFEDFVLKDISFNREMMLLAYLLIISVIAWAVRPNFSKAMLALAVLILFQLTSFHAVYVAQKQEEFIVFSSRKKTLITQRNGNKVLVYTNNGEKQLPALKPYLTANFCTVKSRGNLVKLYYFKDRKILLIDSSCRYKGVERPDVLLLANSPKINLERVFKYWKPKEVVADASNFKSYARRWKVSCSKEKIPFHDVSEKGFYKLD